jgi:hypothetical protein
VHQQRHATLRHDRQRQAEVLLGDRRKLVDAGRHQKALEAAHAGVDERIEFRGIPRDDTTPESHVDMTLCACSRDLRVQSVDAGGRRHAVERHVHERRDAAAGRGPRGRIEAFPLGTPRLVDMHVRVDQARRDHQVGHVEHSRAGRVLACVFDDAFDDAAGDVQRGRPLPFRQDDAVAAND